MSIQNNTARPQQRGFTLIEVMVVIVIIGMMVAIVGPNIIGQKDQASITVAKTEMSGVAQALEYYKLANHHYPSTDQGLEALVRKPSGTPEPKNWGPNSYMKKIPTDPWGNEFVYISPGSHGAFDLYSLGADGREGGEGENADIKNWEE